jgi:hypothetical protein
MAGPNRYDELKKVADATEASAAPPPRSNLLTDEETEQAKIDAKMAVLRERGEFKTPQDAMNMRMRLVNEALVASRVEAAKAQLAEDKAAVKETNDRAAQQGLSQDKSKDGPER